MKISINTLLEISTDLCDTDLLSQSRVHRLNQWPGNVYLKREDESGFGISGTKKRKIASLLPYLKKHGYQEVIAIGGGDSNHIAGLSQVLTENKIGFHHFLKQSHRPQLTGNRFLTHLLANPNQIHWINTEDWQKVHKKASLFAEGLPHKALVIPEGGNFFPSVPGLITLLADIERNEKQHNLLFDHIWIDSGSGLSASVLVWINYLLKRPCNIHIVLMAGDEPYFQTQMEQTRKWLSVLFKQEVKGTPILNLYPPATAKAFGSVNSTVIQEVIRLAREEGVLADPIYMAKLMLTTRKIMESSPPAGNSLIIHSGGGTGLMGFSEKLSKTLI
ncbi:1-aminocyclopropane-1-carboxylate deaminase [bacterium]|nr:1-aminocyclopropane-1-carboxylate deaminase [bacterium]